MMLQASNTDFLDQRRRQCLRERSNSSLDGLLLPIAEEPSDLPLVDENSCMTTTQQQQNELRMLRRRLRQVKRRLLLKSVEKPTNSVDQLRCILLQLSVNEVQEVTPAKEHHVTTKPLVEANKKTAPAALQTTPLKSFTKGSSSVETKKLSVLNTQQMKRNKVVANSA